MKAFAHKVETPWERLIFQFLKNLVRKQENGASSGIIQGNQKD